MIKPEVLDAMVEAGCSAAQIAAAVKADAQEELARASRKREVDAARKRRQRSDVTLSHADSSGHAVTDADKVSPKKEIPPTPPKEKTTPSNSSPVGSARAGFDEFWTLFPNKVGKRDAQTAFDRALTRADLDTIMAGLRRYVAKTDDRPWCNPATFLNQDRWADQPAALVPKATAPPQRKPNAVDAMQEIFKEKGWSGEPDSVSGHNGDAQRLPAERGGPSSAVVDLREGPDGTFGHRH